MRTAIAAPMRGQLERRIDITVIQIPGRVVTDRLAAAAAENLLAAADPLPPLATTAPMRRAVPLAVPAVPYQPRASRRNILNVVHFAVSRLSGLIIS